MGSGTAAGFRRSIRGVVTKIQNHPGTEGTEELDGNGFGDGRRVPAFGLWRGHKGMEAGKDTKLFEGEGPGVGVRARRLVRGVGAKIENH